MRIVRTTTSSDTTKKYYFNILGTSQHIEACLLYLQRYGYIICVSSQIGCKQKCKFCAAGNTHFFRDLTVAEIEQQIDLIVRDNLELSTNNFQVTYMGSGEPLANYKNVFASIDMIRQKYDKLSKVNISTTCPIESKECFESVNWNKYVDFVHFQYSLHFTSDTARREYLYPFLMNISDAICALNNISSRLNDIYKINYIPFDNLNDDLTHIEQLKKIMDTTNNAVLKVSNMCQICNSELLPSRFFDEFSHKIKETIPDTEIFRSHGIDINAGCGQFYNESIT